MAMTLKPRSEHRAIIAGLGRGMTETLLVEHNGDVPPLRFNGHVRHNINYSEY